MEGIGTSIVLLDSNYVIGILNRAISAEDFLYPHSVISAVTVMELYALSGMSPEEERRIDEAVQHLNIVPVDIFIAKRAGILARTRKRGKADLIIAATALELNIPLLTNNIRDFKNIAGLKLLSQ